jgi:hypothetical protein
MTHLFADHYKGLTMFEATRSSNNIAHKRIRSAFACLLALLVDQLGAGRPPMPKARQIKLRAPLQDRALLGRLKGVSVGAIRFSHVQVEGFWRAGVLLPLSIVLVT